MRNMGDFQQIRIMFFRYSFNKLKPLKLSSQSIKTYKTINQKLFLALQDMYIKLCHGNPISIFNFVSVWKMEHKCGKQWDYQGKHSTWIWNLP